MRPFLARTALASLLALGSASAVAAPCAGFIDVQDTDSFCTAVEWIKNRNITLGCTATTYCPASAVTRASMALFLNRLGTALTPRLEFVEAALGAVDPDASPSLCPTVQIASTPYPRQALVSVAFGGQSAGDLGYAARPMVSTDNGATWNPVTDPANDIRESVVGAAWTNSATSGVYAIPATQSVRFAFGVARHSGDCRFHASALPGHRERHERERYVRRRSTFSSSTSFAKRTPARHDERRAIRQASCVRLDCDAASHASAQSHQSLERALGRCASTRRSRIERFLSRAASLRRRERHADESSVPYCSRRSSP